MIESKTNKIIYLGDGTNRVFNIDFDVINYSTDLKLFLTEVNSNEITEIQDNFYIDEVNKTVTYPTVDSGLQPLSSDEQIVILRETNITQELDSKNFFKSSDVEFIADKLTMIAQDLKEKTDRSFIGPVTSNENYSEDIIDAIAEEVSSKINAEQIISEHNSDEAAHPYLLNETNTLKNDLGDLGDQVAGIEAKIPAEAGKTNQLADKRFVRDLTSALNFVKWVDTLPETGENKYIYAVPREETDTEGKQIAALYLWDGSAWRGAGAFSLNIDPDTLATKTELAGYLPKTGGYITGPLSIQREKGLIDTLMPEAGSGSGYTRLRIYSYDDNWVGYLLRNTVGNASILLVDGGHLNIDVANNKEARIGGKRILTIGDKGVANGLASLDANGKVPQEQLPNISAATSVVGLGQIAEASFEVNKNYAASVSGGASITLPTPADTTIANKITVNLTVLSAANIDWGVNANAALAQFEPGKYEIRLLWNNNSSAWTAEVLKEMEAESAVKLLVRFNGNMTDESASPLTLTPSRTVTAFPVYAEGQYGAQKLTCTGDSTDNYVLASGINLPKLDLGTGDFTIRCWLTLASVYSYPVRIFYKDDNNQIALGHDRIHIRIGGNLLLNQGFSGVNAGDTAYITLTRKNGVLYFFVNGTLVTSQASAEAWNLSDWTQIFKGSGVAGTGHYGIQELIVKNTCDYIASFTVPTAPFALTDSGVSDLHDDKKADIDLSNTPSNIDYVVESYSDDSGNWYRIYKSGWIEQGGYTNAGSTVTLLKPMANTYYTVLSVQRETTGPTEAEGSPRAGVISTTQIFVLGGSATFNVNFYVCGQSAS